MKRLAVSVVALLLFVPLAVRAQIPDRPEAIRVRPLSYRPPAAAPLRHELSNGVVVFIAEDHSLPLVDVFLALPVGDYLDPADQVGLASLTGAMMRRGGTRGSSPDELDEAAAFLAAEIDSVSGATRAGVTLNCLAAVLPEALDLWSSVLLEPAFDAERLRLAKSNVLVSLEARNDDGLSVLEREWGFLLRGEAHYSSRQVTPAHLEAIARDDLVAFHRRHWRPDRAVIAVSGAVETGRALELLEERLAGWRASSQTVAVEPPAPGVELAPPGLYHVEHPTPQAKVLIGHQGARRTSWSDPESFALLVMNEVLGGGGTISRLRSRLRAEEGLVYRTSSHFSISLHDAGQFRIFLETEPADVSAAVRGAVAEMRRLRREDVPEVELRLAQKALTDGFPLLFDSAEKLAGRYAEDVLLGRPHEYWQTYRQRVLAIGAADVRGAARRRLDPGRLLLLVVGAWGELGGPGVRPPLVGAVKGPTSHLPTRDPVTMLPIVPGSD